MKFLGLVWSNLGRRKLRTALTILSILVAFLLYGYLVAIREGFSVGVTIAGKDRLIVRHKVSLIQTLPVSYKERIANMPGVDAVVHFTWFGGVYQDPKNFFATMPTEPETLFDLYPEIVVSAEQKQAWQATRNSAIVGRTLMNQYKWKIGDRIPLTAPIWGEPAGQSQWELEIAGIYDTDKQGFDTSTLYFRYDYFDEARTRDKGQIGWYVVRVKDPDQAAEVAAKIDEMFANSPYETKAEPEGVFAASFAKQMGDIGAIVTGILSAVFFTILLVAGNTMAQSVRERTEEIGVLKAIGFTNQSVLFFVILESCLIAALGGFVGLGLAWLIISAGNPVPNLFPVFYVPHKDLLWGALFVVVLGVVAGLSPAIQAMRLRIAEALRRNA